MTIMMMLAQAETATGPAWWQWLTGPSPWAVATGLAVVAVAAVLADVVAKQLILTTIGRVVRRTAFAWDDVLQEHHVFSRLAHLAPAATVYYGVALLPNLPESIAAVITRGASAAVVLVLLLVIGAFLSAAGAIVQSLPRMEHRPVKGYVQIVKLILYIMGGIVIVATVIDQSPLIFLSGIGAMTAVLLLIFRDTILSFVASLQLASYDLVRVGDWIEVPQFGADGDVIDIALHTIQVQNWDKTITTIPTHKLIDGSFKNWRGMSESGGRRIKRAIYIDMNSIRFLDEADIERFTSFDLLRDYITDKRAQLGASRGKERQDVPANTRRLTNIGTFRVYAENYLRHHPKVHRGMTLMVRQLPPTPDGLPLEVYAFSNDTNWTRYEGIQADIFDHLLAIAPEFGVRVFQHPSGLDFARGLAGSREAAS
jgi:miniconductance mechanosensitive channel